MSAVDAIQPRKLAWARPPLRLLFWLLCGLRSSGKEKLPAHGPFLLASNHRTYLDPILVDLAQDEGLAFIAWDALFRVPVLGPVMRWMAAFPVSIQRDDIRAWRTALGVLRAGHRLVIFPEGGRSTDDEPLPLKPGAALMAMQAGVPIVPVHIDGADRVWPKGRLLRPAYSVRVTFGDPIYPPTGKLPPAERDAAAAAIMNYLEAFFRGETPPPPALPDAKRPKAMEQRTASVG